MYEYKSFKFCRRDQYNLDLYQTQQVVLGQEGGRGAHLRKKIADEDKGKTVSKTVLIGHYSNLEFMIYRMMMLEIENKEFKDMLSSMEEFKADIKKFLSDIKLDLKSFEPEGKFQADKDDEPSEVEE